MLRREKYKIKRGFVLVSTLLICIVCIAIVLIVYKLELQERNYAVNYKNYVANMDANLQYRELLLTRLMRYIDVNISVSGRDSIESFFSSREVNINTDNNKAKLCYDKTHNCFIISYYIDEYFHKEDNFDFKIENNKVYFIFKGSLYLEGKLV